MLIEQLLAAQSDDAVMVEDAFATSLYTGTGSSQTITTDINLTAAAVAGSPLMQGGLVWIKGRSATYGHRLFDTQRGSGAWLESSAATAQSTDAISLTAFSASGFTVGTANQLNSSNTTYAAWTFRRAKKFFDVVTYTGDGVNGRTIPHGLGVAPGLVIVKRTDSGGNWATWHRGTGTTNYIQMILNGTQTGSVGGYSNEFTASSFFPALMYDTGGITSNVSGAQYVAYVFAHDPDPTGIIQCGTFTTDASGNATIPLGWEPQWAVFKHASTTGNWTIFDEARGWVTDGASSAFLCPNLTSVEAGTTTYRKASTGMTFSGGGATNTTFIYMAIRRGPMRVPTDPTKVFQVQAATTPQAGFPTAGADMVLGRGNRSTTANTIVADSLRGYGAIASPILKTNLTDAEASPTTQPYVFRSETLAAIPTVYLYLTSASSPLVGYAFKRAPGFFDQVCYTSDGAVQQVIPHNLGVRPELVITKRRSAVGNWAVAVRLGTNDWRTSGAAGGFALNTTSATLSASTALDLYFNATSFQAGFVGVGFESTSTLNATYVSYLFASCPGVSKIGTYTGTAADQTIACGFAPRFVMIKAINGVSDWFIFDTARGIVAAGDPYIRTNTTQAEVTGSDWIDPVTGGFSLPAASALNSTAVTAIYFAIA